MTFIKLLKIIPCDPRGGIYRVNLDLIDSVNNEPDIYLHVALLESKSYTGEYNFGRVQPDHTIISGNIFQKFLQLKALINQFDIVHLHGFTLWVGLVLLNSRPKVVYTNHGLLGVGRKLKNYEYIKKALMKRFLRYRVDHIINISLYAQNKMICEYRVGSEKNSIVHNCSRWQMYPPRFNPGIKLNIGFHGRFAEVKRIDRLIKVASIISKKQAVEVTLLGDGPLKAYYQQLSNEFGINIQFIDYTLEPRSVVITFDVEIISSDEEYFGLAVIESILVGNPTFVFKDSGGCTEIFGDIFPEFIAEDEVDMADKILALYNNNNDEHLQKRMVELQTYVKTHFSFDKFKMDYLRQYRNIVANKPQVK